MRFPVRSEPDQSRGLFQNLATHSGSPATTSPNTQALTAEWTRTQSEGRWYKPTSLPSRHPPPPPPSAFCARLSARRSDMFRRASSLLDPTTTSRLLSFFLAALLISIASLSAAAQDKTLSPEKRAQIEKAVSAFMTANSVPGVSIAVVQNGQPVWSAGFGMADLEDSAPATSSTLYRLGSISKPITAVAILQLYERGKLDLDAPVQKYCPAFPQKDSPITSRQLLPHLSGIRHYNQDGKGDVPDDSARHFASMEESLQLFASGPLLSKPGTQFHYSTYGYTLLGCVLEGAASQKYVDYVRENILRPAAMEHTQADDFFAIVPHRTRWYHRDQ